MFEERNAGLEFIMRKECRGLRKPRPYGGVSAALRVVCAGKRKGKKTKFKAIKG